MNKQQIIEMYEQQLEEAETSIEKSTIKFEMKKHLEAYEKGEEYKNEPPAPFECFGCSA